MKYVKIFAVSLGVILIALILIPFFFQDKLVQLVKEELNKSVEATIDFSSARLSLIRSFPDFSLTLSHLVLTGKAAFENDTLLYADRFSLTLDILSVFKASPYEIKNIRLKEPLLHLIVLEDGHANWDIMPETESEIEEPTTSTDSFSLSLKALQISNGSLIYDDREIPFVLKLDQLNGQIKGDLSTSQSRLYAGLQIASIGVIYDGMAVLNKVNGFAEAVIDVNFDDNSYVIATDVLKLNELGLDFAGKFILADTAIGMDFTLAAAKENFKQLLSLIPSEYMRDYEQLIADGNFDLNFRMNGNYSETAFPAFNASMTVDRGVVAYPDIAEKIEYINLKLKIENETGDLDHTRIILNPFQFSLMNDPFSMNLTLQQIISDPFIKADLKGKLHLDKLGDFIPPEFISSLDGLLTIDVALNTRLSSIEQQQFEQIQVEGSALADGFKVNLAENDSELVIQHAWLGFSPKAVSTKVNELRWGKSDFSFSGELDNYLDYLLRQGILNGSLNLTSSYTDINLLLSHFAIDTTSTAVDDTISFSLELPDRMNIRFHANIDQLVYENYELKNLEADLRYSDKVIQIAPLSATLLGGNIHMSGSFDAVQADSPLIDFDITLNHFDIPTAYQSIGLFQTAAPIAQRTHGSFSTHFHLRGNLDQDMQPVLPSLKGGGGLTTSNIRIDSVKAMNMLASLLGNSDYARLVTDAVDLSFEFINGRVFQKPFMLRYAGSDVTISGSMGFDQTLDYDLLLRVPYEKLGSSVRDGVSKLVEQAGGKGFSLKADTDITIKAKMTGSATDPKLSIDYKDYASNLSADLKRLAQQEMDKQKAAMQAKLSEEAAKIMAEARAHADRLIAQANSSAKAVKSEADKAAKKIRDEAEQQAAKLINEARPKGPIAVKIAEEAAKKLRQQADKTAENIEQQAEKSASTIQQEAQKKADGLIQEAERKVKAL
ncbi:MAG: AsmA family protein [Bacteroidales bacterium]|nr:AsmA family protein [Bacteroidales bacterium]